MGVDDLVEPHNLENLRRSITMLQPGRRDGLNREKALQIIAELQRLQRQDRRYRQLVEQLRDILSAADG
jgi:hypothetical protein